MDIRVVERSGDRLLLELRGIDLGFTYAVVKELLRSRHVLNAWSKREHPLEPQIKFFVLTDGSIDPVDALSQALSRVKEQLGALKRSFLEALEGEA